MDRSSAATIDLNRIGTSFFEREQAEILQIVDETVRTAQSRQRMGKRFSWNRFNRNVACRVVGDFLEKHLEPDRKPVGPGVFIRGYPVEFDLMIVRFQAGPASFTNAFEKDSVNFVVEIRSHGYINMEYPERLKSAFERITQAFPNVKCAYLSMNETWTPKNPGSVGHIERMRGILEPRYPVFCLRDSGTGDMIQGQWEGVVRTFRKVGLRSSLTFYSVGWLVVFQTGLDDARSDFRGPS